VGGTVENGDPTPAFGDLLAQHGEGCLVAVGDDRRAFFPPERFGHQVHVGELLGHEPAQAHLAGGSGSEQHAHHVTDPDVTSGRLFAAGLAGGGLLHEPVEHRPERLAAFLHRRLEFPGRQVGMDEIAGLVVDLVELEFESEQPGHAQLGRSDGTGRRLPWLRHPGLRRGDQFVEHGVVAGEGLVEPVVVVRAADVDGGHEIDLQRSPAVRIGRLHVGDDRRVERPRSVCVIPHDPQEFDPVLFFAALVLEAGSTR